MLLILFHSLARLHFLHLAARGTGLVQAQRRLEQTVLQITDQAMEGDLLQLAIGIGLHLALGHILLIQRMEAGEDVTQVEGGGQRGDRQGRQQLEEGKEIKNMKICTRFINLKWVYLSREI